MSDPEFDAYLSLLARLLRLSPRQRDDIRRELRDHMEASVDAQLARGVPRDRAVRTALEEFGDAAELAARFGSLNTRKRWMMKGSLVAACLSVAFLSIQGFSPRPASDMGDSTRFGGPTAQRAHGHEADSASAAADEAIRTALGRTLAEVNFEDLPLHEVFDQIADLTQSNIHVQWQRLESTGVNRDAPVRVKLRNVSAARVMGLVLDEFPDVSLAYDVLDGVVVVSTFESLLRDFETRVYDVRDLLGSDPVSLPRAAHTAPTQPPPSGDGVSGAVGGLGYVGARGAGGAGHAAPAAGGAAHAGSSAGRGMGAAVDPLSGCGPASTDERVQRLLAVVRGGTGPELWSDEGGAGYLSVYNGMLVVRHSRTVQKSVAALLDGLSARERAQ